MAIRTVSTDRTIQQASSTGSVIEVVASIASETKTAVGWAAFVTIYVSARLAIASNKEASKRYGKEKFVHFLRMC